jgi:hypothetical protein
MSGVPGATSVADRFPLSPLWIGESVAGAGFVGVCGMWVPDFGNGWNDLPGHAHSFASVVSRDVVGDHPEERGQRVGTATSAGAEKI